MSLLQRRCPSHRKLPGPGCQIAFSPQRWYASAAKIVRARSTPVARAFAQSAAEFIPNAAEDEGPILVDNKPVVETAEPYVSNTFHWKGHKIHYAVRLRKIARRYKLAIGRLYSSS